GRQSTSRTRFRRLSLAAVKILAIDPVFERALSAEIAASELFRVRVLAATLAVLLVAEQLLFLFARDLVEQFTQKPLPAWLPAQIIGPFLAYEIVALLVCTIGLRLAVPSQPHPGSPTRSLRPACRQSYYGGSTSSQPRSSRSALGRRCSISSSSSPRPCGSTSCFLHSRG